MKKTKSPEANYRSLVEIIKNTAPKLCVTEKSDFGWVLPLYVFLLRSLQSAAKDGDTRCLKFLAAIGEDAYSKVMDLGVGGDETAAALLSEDLVALTRRLGSRCYINPKPFRAVARNKIEWPAVMTCTNDWAEDCESVRKHIALGRDTGLKFDGKIAKQRGSKIARRLYHKIQRHRESWVGHWPESYEHAIQHEREKEAEALRKLPTFKFNCYDEREFLLGESADVFRAWCRSLPVLSRDKAVLKEWGKAARVAFAVMYGQKYEDDREFAENRRAIKLRAKKKPTEYGKIYQQRNAVRIWIWKDIMAGLQSIAAKPTDETISDENLGS